MECQLLCTQTFHILISFIPSWEFFLKIGTPLFSRSYLFIDSEIIMQKSLLGGFTRETYKHTCLFYWIPHSPGEIFVPKMVYSEENKWFILYSLMSFIVWLFCFFLQLQYSPEGKFEKSVKVNLAVISKSWLLQGILWKKTRGEPELGELIDTVQCPGKVV